MSGRAGRRAANARDMQTMLAARGFAVEACATGGPGDATRVAREAVKNSADVVVCYGGDGTINEVIQAVAGTPASLAVWAGGTANVIARELGMPFDTKRVAQVIAARKTIRVALGIAVSESGGAKRDRVSFDASESQRGRYFLMMAGIGLDAAIARSVNTGLKRRTGEFAYWLSGIRHLLFWKPEMFIVEADGQRFESAFTVIGKGKGYGGEMLMTPGASLSDARFELFILPLLPNNFSYLRVLIACLRGKPQTPQATIIKAGTVHANSNRSPWVEVDGELLGPLPMKFEVVPDALSLVVP